MREAESKTLDLRFCNELWRVYSVCWQYINSHDGWPSLSWENTLAGRLMEYELLGSASFLCILVSQTFSLSLSLSLSLLFSLSLYVFSIYVYLPLSHNPTPLVFFSIISTSLYLFLSALVTISIDKCSNIFYVCLFLSLSDSQLPFISFNNTPRTDNVHPKYSERWCDSWLLAILDLSLKSQSKHSCISQ